MLNIVLFGPPGSGKGTQSAKLVEKYNLLHLSTGDILRGEIAAGTQLGLEAKTLMNQGILVPDEIVIGMISNKLEANPNANGFIFDGFPRTTAQAVALDDLLSSKHSEITATLALEVDNEELTKRLLYRGQQSGRPDDQNEEIIRNRISEYNNKTAPLKIYYASQNKFHTVNGIGSIDEIFASLCDKVDTIYKQNEFFSHNDVAGTPFIHSIDIDEPNEDSDILVQTKVSIMNGVSHKPISKPVVKQISKKVAAKKKPVRPSGKKAPSAKAKTKKKVKVVAKKKKTAGKKTTVKKKKTANKKVNKKIVAKKSSKKTTRKVTRKITSKKKLRK